MSIMPRLFVGLLLHPVRTYRFIRFACTVVGLELDHSAAVSSDVQRFLSDN